MHTPRTRGANNNYSLESIMFNHFTRTLSVLTSARVFMRREAIPPLRGGAVSSSTKYPNDSSRPPKPSFPPYDVGTLHFVACGRPWLVHWRGVHTHRTWSLIRGATTTTRRRAHVARMVFFARDCGPWQARERRAEREKVARASSCNRNVEKPLVF